MECSLTVNNYSIYEFEVTAKWLGSENDPALYTIQFYFEYKDVSTGKVVSVKYQDDVDIYGDEAYSSYEGTYVSVYQGQVLTPNEYTIRAVFSTYDREIATATASFTIGPSMAVTKSSSTSFTVVFDQIADYPKIELYWSDDGEIYLERAIATIENNSEKTISYTCEGLKIELGTKQYLKAKCYSHQGLAAAVLKTSFVTGVIDDETESGAPIIENFDVQQTEVGSASIVFSFKLSNCYQFVENDYYFKDSVVDIYVNDKPKFNEDGKDLTFQDGIREGTGYIDIADFGTNIIRIEATNRYYRFSDGLTYEYKSTKTTVIEVREQLACTLNCTWEDKQIEDEYQQKFTCCDYPVITAENFNRFCSDINAVRLKKGMYEVYFENVFPDTPMKASLWNDVIGAIYQMTDLSDDEIDAKKKKIHARINKTFIEELESTLKSILTTNNKT